MSLSHILCGVFGFLLGSVGVAEGSRKRNPLVFSVSLFCLLAGAAAFFMALVNRAVDEAEAEAEEEELEEEEEVVEKAAEAAEAVAEEVADAAEEVAEAAEEDAEEAAEDAE